MISPHKEYFNKLKIYEDLIKKQDKSINSIGYFRLFTFIIGLAVTAYTFVIKSYTISGIVFAVFLGIFIYLVNIHNKEMNKRKYSIALKKINERSLKRLNGEWKNFKDDGEEFIDKEHSYSYDLDIFGKCSLFQWINVTKTFMGRHNLKERLLNPLKEQSNIKATQEGINELARSLDLRQQIEKEGMLIVNKSIDPKELYKWGRSRDELYAKPWLIFLAKLLPCIAVILIALAFTTSFVNYKVLYFIVIIHMTILFLGKNNRSYVFSSIYKYKSNITAYFKLLNLIKDEEFKSEYLINLKNKLENKEGYDAVTAIKKLSNIYDKLLNRQNLFFIILNILFLWDYQCMIEFEKWRINFGKNLEKWFCVIGEFEALSSISNIVYNNPNWAMPIIEDKDFVLKAKNLGHPLLGDKRVCNDIEINKNKNILLITGSNMSGKSTFLRTIGINLVLSYIGASVCAESFKCSVMDIVTCMRTSDNLENNISSFYAEILRIKMIVENVKKDKNVFFMLDELFKGTNSIDRHEGAIALIKQLGKEGASGLISTHDLELCNLEKEYSRIKNYHFREYYENNELKFDYKLKIGASKTRNALYLIKLIGVDLK